MAEKKKIALYKLYKKSGETLERLNKFCPKCGRGFLMAQHNNRTTCGKCKYTEFNARSK